jgi:hypothetical protein
MIVDTGADIEAAVLGRLGVDAGSDEELVLEEITGGMDEGRRRGAELVSDIQVEPPLSQP